MEMRADEPLAPFTYYKIGGPAAYFAQPESLQELRDALSFTRNQKLPLFIMGAGSNLLVDDAGFPGVVIQTGKLNRNISLLSEGVLEAGCSVTVSQLLRFCGHNGLGGLEFLVGVPGNVGGVLAMNAGTRTGDIASVVESVEVYQSLDGANKRLNKEMLGYGYRSQNFLKEGDIILGGRFRVTRAAAPEMQKRISQLLESRKASQPIDRPSCGSVFKNPDPENGIFAWKLIQDCGLKGKKCGGAQISELHANFIINNGGAKSSDVKSLIAEAKKAVQNRFGILLQEEVKMVPVPRD